MAQARIVIVEDERIVARDLQLRLSRLGYDVVGVVSSGEDAVACVERTQPHLVLMDIMLQGTIDGIEAANRIRARAQVPVLYVTAHADAQTSERAKQVSPFGYVLKPFEDGELLRTIRVALERSGFTGHEPASS